MSDVIERIEMKADVTRDVTMALLREVESRLPGTHDGLVDRIVNQQKAACMMGSPERAALYDDVLAELRTAPMPPHIGPGRRSPHKG